LDEKVKPFEHEEEHKKKVW